MITTMDPAGRLVLPKAVRERAQLVPGVPLEVRVVDGRVEIEPATARVTLEQHSGFWVARSEEPVPTLTQDQIDTTVDSLRTPAADPSRGED